MSYEPPLDDPVATGESDECDEPDRMYGDED